MSSPDHELRVLIASFHSLIVIENAEEERIRRILHLVSSQMNSELMEWSSTDGLKCSLQFQNPSASADPAACIEYLRDHKGPAIVWLKDFARELESKVVTRALKDLVKTYNRSPSAVVISGPQVALNEDLKHLALRFDLAFPSPEEYRRAMESVYESLRRTHNVRFNLNAPDMEKLLGLLRGMTLQQARQIAAQGLISDSTFDLSDLSLVEQKKAQVIKEDGLLEYYPVNDNAFELGGLDGFKNWLTKMEAGFSQEARKLKLPQPRGVLMVGVPGCGKSLAAKYVARKWRMPLLKLDAGRLYNKFIGESERNFRRAMQLSESISPSILWIDEIEKSIGVSGSGEMDGGVSKRILGNFLTWLQEKTAPVFVVATANDLFSLPAELMRKGRFDEIFFVDLPSEIERTAIFNVHFGLRKLALAEDKLREMVDLTEGFSGAEIEQIVVGAALASIQGKSAVTMELLREEIRNTIPLSRSRADYISRLREKGGEFRSVN